MKSPRSLAALGVLTLAVLASQPHADTATTTAATPPPAAPKELPWEVIADNGDMVLPDLYYSENSENEQVMSLKVEGRHQIDHLIYPTIGNPKIFFRDNTKDSVLMVLRMEPETLQRFSPVTATDQTGKPIPIRHRDGVYAYGLQTWDKNNGIHILLVSREQRVWPGEKGKTASEINDAGIPGVSIAGRQGVYEIRPTQMGIQPDNYPGMPAEFKKRETVRMYFDTADLKDVAQQSPIPQGLYDIRIETREGGQVTGVDSSYNGLQIYDQSPKAGDNIIALSFSDAQINEGTLFQKFAVPHLQQLVQYLDTTDNPTVQAAMYITFNGDLHDGGAVLQRYPRAVGTEYANEATTILEQLKWLRKPVFLTAGNHDGYVSMGHVPPEIDKVTRGTSKLLNLDKDKFAKEFDDKEGNSTLSDPHATDTIETVINEAKQDSTWPGLAEDKNLDAWHNYINKTANGYQGGYHLDIFDGSHARTVGTDFSSWHEIPAQQRNMVFYDGQYQWRKTYGPLYYDYSISTLADNGSIASTNRSISANSFELRQHWRSGWGMYTVNYGGGMSQVQMDWLSHEIKRFAGDDVTLFAHHDPRGGHNGKDYPFYFQYVDYGSQVNKDDSAATSVLKPNYFSQQNVSLTQALTDYGHNREELHGWYEEEKEKLKDEAQTKFLNKAVNWLGKSYGTGMAYSLVNFMAGESLEGALCPKGVAVADKDVAELGCMHDGLQEWMTRDKSFDCTADARAPFPDEDRSVAGKDAQTYGRCTPGHSWYSGYELMNLVTTHPNVRTMVLGHTHFNSIDVYKPNEPLVPDHLTLDAQTMTNLQALEASGPMRTRNVTQLSINKAAATITYPFERTLQGHELVILRVTTAADLTSQYVSPVLAGDAKKAKMYGFQALTFFPNDASGQKRLNQVDYYRNMADNKADYRFVTKLDINRGENQRAADGFDSGQTTEAKTADGQTIADLVKNNPLSCDFRFDAPISSEQTAQCQDKWKEMAPSAPAPDFPVYHGR